MNSHTHKHNACVHFLRRKGYTIIFLVFSVLLLSQLRHLLNISRFLENVPSGSVHMGITNNTTLDFHAHEGDGDVMYVVVGEGSLNVRTLPRKTSPMVAVLHPGTVIVANINEVSNSRNSSDRIFISHPVKGWISVATARTRIESIQSRLPTCLPDSFLPGVKFAMKKGPVISDSPRRPVGRNARPPPFGAEMPPSAVKIERFVIVNTTSQCCHACARSPACGGWTFLGSMCLFREAGASYKIITGLGNSVVSGNMEFSAMTDHKSVGGTDESDDAKLNFNDYVLIIDPMRYLRKGHPFSSILPRWPSSWLEQWVIGNGRVGALVGGYAHEEVIPVSIAGLHIISGNTGADAVRTAKKNNILTTEGAMVRNYYPHKKDPVRLPAETTASEPPRKRREASPNELFRESREALMDGDTGMAQIILTKAVDDKSYGQTQYAFDMVFIFSTEPIKIRVGGEMEVPEAGRMGRLMHLKNVLDLGSNSVWNVMHARSFFDTVTGIASSSFLSRAQTDLRAMHREWFASVTDDVLVGRIQCRALSHSSQFRKMFPNGPSIFKDIGVRGKGCLHMAYKVDREMSQTGDLLADKFIRIVRWRNRRDYGMTLEPQGGSGDDVNMQNTMAFSLSHAPTCHNHMHRYVESCGVIVCGSGESTSESRLEWGVNAAGAKAIICNGADEAVVISTSVIGNYPDDVAACQGTGSPYSSNKGHVKSLRQQCWTIIDAAMSTASITESVAISLKRRHIAAQAPVMAASDVVFGGGEGVSVYSRAKVVEMPQFVATSPAKPAPILTDYRCTLMDKDFHDPELLSFQQECVQAASSSIVRDNEYKLLDSVSESANSLPSVSPTENIPYSSQQVHALRSLLTATYARSKYMLYASGARQVSLLQGLWVDGAFTAWNGDFHLNINLQMSYWAAPALPEVSSAVAPALAAYIQQLAAAGESTARRLYNCSGWVAHGYVDNLMNAGIRGGLMWNMCVTCGAWLALHLWDQLSHSFDATLLVHVLLPVYRDIARFFIDYMFLGSDGHMHTGPTASPENSYILRQDKNEKFSSRYVRVVTHSPNIDMAVLRQISNIYSLALSWAEMEKDGSTVLREYLETPEYKTDMGLSVSFREIIEKMPNGAVPKISERKEVDTSAVPGTNKVLPHETSKKTLSKFVIDEYSSAPLTTSERRGIKNYMYASRPNSDRYLHESSNMMGEKTIDVENITMPVYSTSEEIDRGHRHFSSLLWLYPGTFLPSALALDQSGVKSGNVQESQGLDRVNIYTASLNLLKVKVEAGGGHTAWSSVWEACLAARLRQTQVLERALQKLMARYFTPNLLSVHPAIDPVPPSSQNDNFGCDSCYRDFNNNINDGWKLSSVPQRGMMTTARGQFQFDGNAGLLAAVHEMLLQSHVPQVIAVLPAITASLREQGMVRRLRARGGIMVSFMWRAGAVTSAIIDVPAWHPAFRPLEENKRGFFREQSQKTPHTLTFVFPNNMVAQKITLAEEVLQSASSSGVGDQISSYFKTLPASHRLHSSFQSLEGDVLHSLRLPPPSDKAYPVTLYLCNKSALGSKCRGDLEVLGQRLTPGGAHGQGSGAGAESSEGVDWALGED